MCKGPTPALSFPKNTNVSLFYFLLAKLHDCNGLNPDQIRPGFQACSGLKLFAKAGSNEAKVMLHVNNYKLEYNSNNTNIETFMSIRNLESYVEC